MSRPFRDGDVVKIECLHSTGRRPFTAGKIYRGRVMCGKAIDIRNDEGSYNYCYYPECAFGKWKFVSKIIDEEPVEEIKIENKNHIWDAIKASSSR